MSAIVTAAVFDPDRGEHVTWAEHSSRPFSEAAADAALAAEGWRRVGEWETTAEGLLPVCEVEPED